MRFFGGTLARYFGFRCLNTILLVFVSIFLLVVLIDYIEMMRRSSDIPNVSPLLVAKVSLYRVPQVTERILPFCVLIGTMICYLDLSRRLELVIARSAGVSAWQFIAPALVAVFVLGIVATTIYNPLSAILDERSKRYEAELFKQDAGALSGSNYWTSQRTNEGQAIINAKSSRDQGVNLNGVTVFTFDNNGRFKQRIEARAAVLEPGVWQLKDARVNELGVLPVDYPVFQLKTSLT
ncbi:MAG: LptF/LptG family permease, partial [Pseudolabrys sp.]